MAVLLRVAGQVIRRLPHVSEKGDRSVGRPVIRVKLSGVLRSIMARRAPDGSAAHLGEDPVHLAARAVVLSAEAWVVVVGQEMVAKERVMRKYLQDDVEKAGLA